MTVSREIYHATDHAERRRLGKEFERLRELHESTEPVRERYRARVAAIKLAPLALRQKMAAELDRDFGQIRGILGQPKIPIRLLACAECGHPTTACTCTDESGQPLSWS